MVGTDTLVGKRKTHDIVGETNGLDLAPLTAGSRKSDTRRISMSIETLFQIGDMAFYGLLIVGIIIIARRFLKK